MVELAKGELVDPKLVPLVPLVPHQTVFQAQVAS